jgi:plasmid stabilization system protein ParE
MLNGYKILWTDLAIEELEETIKYLEEDFSQKEIKKLAKEIERVINLISQNPTIFPLSEKKNLRKVVILKFNSMFYRVANEQVQIISFFNNRKNPKKRKF